MGLMKETRVSHVDLLYFAAVCLDWRQCLFLPKEPRDAQEKRQTNGWGSDAGSSWVVQNRQQKTKSPCSVDVEGQSKT